MSAVLERTLNYLTSSGTGPRWTVPANQQKSCSHLPHGCSQFIRAAMEAPTRADLDSIVDKQLEMVKARLTAGNATTHDAGVIKSNVLADCVVRGCVAQLLAMPSSGKDIAQKLQFLHIYAIQLATQKGKTIGEKKLGYLACVLLLEHSGSELLVLLTNTMLTDLKSDNVVEVNIALVAAAHLVPNDMIPVIFPIVLQRTNHPKEFIRKKALICLEQMMIKAAHDDGEQVVQLSTVETRFRSALTDTDPGVVMTAIQVMKTAMALKSSKGPIVDESYADLANALLCIQDQALSGKLPKQDFDYGGISAPWLQVQTLQLLAVIAVPDSTVETITAVSKTISNTLASTNVKETIGQAVIYESVNLVAKWGLEDLVGVALTKTHKMVSGNNSNVRFMGLCCLEKLISMRSSKADIASEAADTMVAECLKSDDSCIRNKALEVMQLLANANNVKAICDNMITNLRQSPSCGQEQRRTLIAKTLQLLDKFGSVSLDWTVFVLVRLLQNSHGPQRENILLKIKQTLTGSDSDEKHSVGLKLSDLIAKIVAESDSSHTPPQVVLLLHVWCQAHFSRDQCSSVMEIVRVGNMCLDRIAPSSSSVRWNRLLYASLNSLLLITSYEGDLPVLPDEFLKKCVLLKNKSCNGVVRALSTRISIAAQDLQRVHGVEADKAVVIDDFLSFLDQEVINSLEKGHAPYQPSKASDMKKRCLALSNSHMEEKSSAFNFTPYNVLSEKSPSKEMKKKDVSSSETSNSVDPVWTLKGRSKETNESFDNNKGLGSQDTSSAVSELLAESTTETRDISDIAMKELQQWKD